jgi:hypothetical protein
MCKVAIMRDSFFEFRVLLASVHVQPVVSCLNLTGTLKIHGRNLTLWLL